jgi:phosphoglucomutase
VYLEAYEADVARHHLDAQEALKELIQIGLNISDLVARTGRQQPTVIT